HNSGDKGEGGREKRHTEELRMILRAYITQGATHFRVIFILVPKSYPGFSLGSSALHQGRA
ncbi:MAG TPA: hypothetical protein PK530_14780, partial [Anaerolineales bacterium]|nr:hypothetical protein [Anaerolineales bacterium]